MEIPDELENVLRDIRITEHNIVFVLGDKYGAKLIIVKKSPQFSTFKSNIEKQLIEKRVDCEDTVKIINLVQINYKEIYPDDSDTSNTTQIKIENSKANHIKLDITYEEWQSKLKEKLDILEQSFDKYFPGIWSSVEFTLSIRNVLHIKEITLPFAGIIMGPPSSSKTLVLEMLRDVNNTFYTDSFTPKSFVSHNSAFTEEKLKEVDMLPKIKNKLFVTPELAPIFSAKDEELTQILGIMTRILDGHGYESDTGAFGHRGYKEDTMFTWVGAVVDIPRKVYKQLAILGPKLYFFRLSLNKKKDNEYLNYLKENNFSERKNKVKEILHEYIKWFDQCPLEIKDCNHPSDLNNHDSNLMKISWNNTKNDDNALSSIVKLGKLLAPLRGSAVTWETKDTQGSDYAYSPPIKEDPSRAMTSLLNVAKGHALLEGRNYVTMNDIPILIKIVLSTAPIERVMIFDLLLFFKGEVESSQIMEYLNLSKPTALKTMTEFKVLEIVDIIRKTQSKNAVWIMKLKDEFSWILTEEFRDLRGGFNQKSFAHADKEEHYFNEHIANDKLNMDQICVKKNTPHLEQNNHEESANLQNEKETIDQSLSSKIENESYLDDTQKDEDSSSHIFKNDDLLDNVVKKNDHGLKINQCKFCNKDYIVAFDLEIHYTQYHKKELTRIPGTDTEKKIDDLIGNG